MGSIVHIPGFPSYRISRSGDVFRLGSTEPLRPCKSKRGGYLQVALWEGGIGKTRLVHQLVALSFHGPRPSSRHHAAHRDGNKVNNTDLNVQWITKEENERDKIAHGRANIGSRNGSAILSEGQVSEIRRQAATLPRSSGGKRIKKGAIDALSADFGVTKSCLYQVINGTRWGHVQ